MRITINGKEEQIEGDELTVTELLKIKEVRQPDMVSVELNGSFLERKKFASTLLKEGDRVEFLYFMGGGGGS